MRRVLFGMILLVAGVALFASSAVSQPPGGKDEKGKGAKGAKIGGPLAIEAVALGAFSEPKIEANDFSFSPLRKVVFFEASFAQRYFGVPYAAWNTNTCIPPLLQLRCS